ncbi:DUF3035 domain-containing protein [Roseomonas nepalensis]|uniref:DUF3035 domain-containing protein n=1 Tax=Muricoccus nepalensis TaxID=1854500 RepID=A0A502G7Z2_9PROT|nr:DUF3035 domain-containing protein [Roseomonas nepalensis]TPG58135.1 DUF3035 domain-containing protein [Roseomonas nepalensis]
MTFKPLLLAPLLLLAACGGDTARTLGLTRDAPDEFQVVTRAPLSIPPSMGDLPPPRPGAQRPQEMSARERGETTLAPATITGEGREARPSGAEAALVAQAGRASGAQATGNIRRQVDEESLRLDRPQQNVVERLMFWQDAPRPGTVLDPQREAQRLRENSALGRSPEAGDTPIIQRRQRGLLDGLL